MQLRYTRVSLLFVILFVMVAGSAATVLFTQGAVEAAPQKVEGEYIEARTCDVWTGPCFSSSEINLTGDNAVMGWAIRTGTWNGVRLDGLKVAASIDADGTLGSEEEGKVRSVLYVDQKASQAQGKALIDMAKALAPTYLKNVLKVYTGQRISFSRVGSRATFRVGNEVELRTMALSMHCDIICGNEEQAYPTLATTLSAECAKTVAHSYRGRDLGCRWSDPGARSAMIGSFSLPRKNLVVASP